MPNQNDPTEAMYSRCERLIRENADLRDLLRRVLEDIGAYETRTFSHMLPDDLAAECRRALGEE